MKKNNELDFNFGNTPYKPAKSAEGNVERIAKKPAPTPPPAQQKQQNYRWGKTAAPSSMLTPDEIMHMSNEPAPRAAKPQAEKKQVDVRKAEQNPIQTAKPEVKPEPEKIPMTSVKRETPAVETESNTVTAGYSSAAIEIMRRMQKAESKKAEVAVTETPVKIAPPPSEVIKTNEIAEKAAVPAKAEDKVTTESDAIAAREAKAESFELDRSAMEEGMNELDVEMTQAFTIDEEDGGTKMFAPVTVPEAPAIDDGATKHISLPDAVDELYGADEESKSKSVIDEYNSVDEAQSVTRDLISRKRWLGARVVLTLIYTILLFAVTCTENLIPFGDKAYFIAIGVLLGLSVVTNITTFSSLISVFTMKPDVDFIPSFAVLAAAVQTGVTAFVGTSGLTYTSMFAAVAVLALTASTIAKRLTVSRTLANFELIANEEVKQSGALIEPPQSARIVDKSKMGETLILGRRDTIDLKGFIAYSLSPDFYEKQSGKLSLVALIASVISFGTSLLITKQISVSVSMFAATACAAAQIAYIYPNAMLMSRACRKLRERKVMLSGIQAADEISEANVIVLDSDELFFDDCINLYKFRTFGDCAPDDAFMTAHALATAARSPLAGVFGKVCSTQIGAMLDADSIVYENAMGITGWVNERKTLLGNRMIMESHSIPVPSMEVDRKIFQSGKFPVYLAIDNKIAALFIVGYEADKAMLHRMRKLVNTGVTVLVRSVDPNVTADLVCSCYGLPSDSVITMESNASNIYGNHMQPIESAPATLSAPNAEGFADAYTESYAISRRNKASSIAVIVLACVMMALTVVVPAVGMYSSVNIFTSLISNAFTLVMTFILVAFLG